MREVVSRDVPTRARTVTERATREFRDATQRLLRSPEVHTRALRMAEPMRATESLERPPHMCIAAFSFLAACVSATLAAQATHATTASAKVEAQSSEHVPTSTSSMKKPPAAGLANSLCVERMSNDGTIARLDTLAGADTSSVARMNDGRLLLAYQGFPADDKAEFNRTAVRFSPDDGRTWTDAAPIVVDGIDPNLAPPFDPAIVALPDGRVRLYFISYVKPEGKPSAPPTKTSIYSAVSSDGVRYQFEPDVRFTVEGRVVLDAAAALHQGIFHLIVPDNGTASEFLERRERGEAQPGGNGYHAVSKDGIAFERVADLTLPSTQNRWWGNLLSNGDSLLFFGTGPGPWPLVTNDGMRWEPVAKPLALAGVDPCAIRTRDRGLLLITTTEPARTPATPKSKSTPTPTPTPTPSSPSEASPTGTASPASGSAVLPRDAEF